MGARQDMGRRISEGQGQVARLDDAHYTVKSQSREIRHDVVAAGFDWTCSCEDYRFRNACCKHIHAVGIGLQLGKNAPDGVVIPEMTGEACRHCKSDRTVRAGVRHNRSGDVQRLLCRDCNRKFSINLGFEGMRATPEQITMAMNLYFNGESTRKVAQSLRLAGISVSNVTIHNWNRKYVELMDRYVDRISPRVGESWRTDELYLRIRGDRKYLFAMLDSETRFWLSQMVSAHKGSDDVAPMFREAEKRASKVPSTLISDGAANFHHAWRKQYRSRNFLHKDTEHHRHIHISGDLSNNQMESFNGNTLRAREKVIRGIKKDGSAILKGMQIHHNYIRPHQGLDGDTPAGRAGIRILGSNKWKTIIQNAASCPDS